MTAIFDQQEDIYRRAMAKWGTVSQMLKAIEEMSELTAALMHWLGDRAGNEDVCEEIADVLITARQLRLIFGEAVTDRIIEEKLNRLDHLIREREDEAMKK
ncbi:MAG: hypothetical protein A4E69_00279 [Syntrophus sp. PtaB.Bin138]|nr:MAG: hypothetical protein A4E69_00279 [Syntrophus sp. PtaB.Bin138]